MCSAGKSAAWFRAAFASWEMMRRPVIAAGTVAAAIGAAAAALVLAASALPAAGAGAATPAGNVAAGAKVFASAGCAACHTLASARATGRVGPNLDRLKPTAARVVRQVRLGGGAMPPFAGRLTAKQIAEVAAFVEAASRGKATGTKPARQPQDGRSLFRTFCAAATHSPQPARAELRALTSTGSGQAPTR